MRRRAAGVENSCAAYCQLQEPGLSSVVPATRAKLGTRANRKIFQVVVAAMDRRDQQRRRSSLHNILSTLVRKAKVYRLFSSLISSLFTNAGSAQSRCRVIADFFHIDVTAEFGQINYTFFNVMASWLTRSSTGRLVCLQGGDSVTARLQHYAKLAHRSAHRTAWNVQRIIHA